MMFGEALVFICQTSERLNMPNKNLVENKLEVVYVPINELKPANYNPRRWDQDTTKQLTESITRYGLVDPIVVNSAQDRKNIVIGGHFRLHVAKQLGYTEIPVVYIHVADLDRERELNIRLNKNLGEFDFELLKTFGEDFLSDVGFNSEELDNVFALDDIPEKFDLEKELKKLNIENITVQKGDVYQLGDSRIMCGDSTVESDVLKLMNNEKADMCFTDPPYILDYLHGKKKSTATEGFGLKRDRKYLETDVLPENFTDLWMDNIAKIQKSDFSIIVYENPKNLRTIWNTLEKHWKYRNTIIWHLPNRVQGFAAKYKLFNKYDFAIVGTSGDVNLNDDLEPEPLLQEEYETALFATFGKPHWESYEKGKKYCPTDFIEYKASDEKSSGQGIIFGTKPIQILIPYIKILTKRDDLIIEPFGGSGSTLIAATKMKRRCYIMEKSPVYTEVIINRWEKLTGLQRKKL
jgi:DNA modification methylase